jgi:hypothetical protein
MSISESLGDPIDNQGPLTIAKLKIYHMVQRGLGPSGRIYFQSEIRHEEISAEQARTAQADAGYHPLGYDFLQFRCQKVDSGYVATWSCSASCD